MLLVNIPLRAYSNQMKMVKKHAKSKEQAKKDQRINHKRQRKVSLSLGVNGL